MGLTATAELTIALWDWFQCNLLPDAEALGTCGDQLEQRLMRRLASKPAATHSFVQAIVLAKAE